MLGKVPGTVAQRKEYLETGFVRAKKFYMTITSWQTIDDIYGAYYFDLECIELLRFKFHLVALYKIIYGYTDLDFNKYFRFLTQTDTLSNGMKPELSYWTFLPKQRNK